MPIRGFEESNKVVKQMKHEIFSIKLLKNPQKPLKKSGQSVENHTIPRESILFEIVLYRGLYYSEVPNTRADRNKQAG